ncbi:YbhN family protein [Streptomyces sp. NPDC048710]|uniref:lysylphosphatidylglycerol synthase transmembrane domain-containing protein n=1 Tax=unclassified Streptomyces TaxID=2593676 RepID=UPI00371DFFC5
MAAAIVVAVSRWQELVEASRLISRVRLPEMAVAVVCEALSITCFAAVPWQLLRAGGVWWRLRRVTAITVAANAVAGALPGGAVFSAAWVFRQLCRRGVEQVLAATVLVLAGALSAVSLFVLLVIGMFTVGSTGSSAVVRPVVGVLALALGSGVVAFGLFRFTSFRSAVRGTWTRAGLRSERVQKTQRALVRLVDQARDLQPGFRPWLWPLSLALLNWVFDAACLAACLWALGTGVPWQGLLLAYTLTQISGSLRLTPGGLGVVEASLATLLVLYGLSPGAAIAATLLYRAVSYWALQPLGWACWFGVTFRTGTEGRTDGGTHGHGGRNPPERTGT